MFSNFLLYDAIKKIINKFSIYSIHSHHLIDAECSVTSNDTINSFFFILIERSSFIFIADFI